MATAVLTPRNAGACLVKIDAAADAPHIAMDRTHLDGAGVVDDAHAETRVFGDTH